MAKGIRPVGTIGVALTAWEMWRKIPPKQRKILLAQVREHGPTVAKKAYVLGRSAAASRKTLR
jgi:hypothetical protein